VAAPHVPPPATPPGPASLKKKYANERF